MRYVWVLDDATNDDGADWKVPKYIWVYETREVARLKQRVHARRGLTRLINLRKVSVNWVLTHYRSASPPHYFVRKESK